MNVDSEKVDQWCERGILGLALGALAVTAGAFGGVETWQILLVRALVIGMLALWGIRLWAGEQPRLLWPPVCWAVLAFTGYALFRYWRTDIEYIARQEVLQILVYAFLFFIVLNNLHRQETMQAMALTMMLLGMAISVYAVCQFVLKSDKVWNEISTYHGRAGGTFYNPNHLAAFLELLLPLAFCYVLAGRWSHVTKIVLGYGALVMIAGVGVTLSRGGWAAMGLELILLCAALLLNRNYRLQALALALVLGCAGALLAPKLEAGRARFDKMVAAGRPTDLRLPIWETAARMWRDNFWLGMGPGQFDYRFPEYQPLELQARPDRAHNEYLNTLVDYGLAGAALLAAAWALLGVGVARAWKAVRTAPDDFARKKSNKFAFLLGTLLGLIGVLAHSVVEFPLHIPAVALLMVAWMALLASQGRFATDRYWVEATGWKRWTATLALVGGIGALGWATGRGGAEWIHWHRATQAPIYSYAQIAELQRAWKAEPKNPATAYAIGAAYRTKSLVGGEEYVALGKQALEWYRQGMALNPHDPVLWLEYGMCLDWLGPEGDGKEDSGAYFRQANALDPNGFYTSSMTALHYVQVGDFAAARTWFDRSRHLEEEHNKISLNYLPIVDRRLEEAAKGR